MPNDDNPTELTWGFAFRENRRPNGKEPQLWYLVGRILDCEDAEDAKSDIKSSLENLSEDHRENANRLIGRLHSRIHTTLVGNYYQERSRDYDKVFQVLVRANSTGQPLKYSNPLLATATAKWETLDARQEVHDFSDLINELGNGYSFGEGFVLKSCLYLTENLPIQLKVKSFTKTHLRTIEGNWDKIKDSVSAAVRFISRFGFSSKNVVAPLALLPIAFYIMKRGNSPFDTSCKAEDADAQVAIRKRFICSALKNAFGGSSHTTLIRLLELLNTCGPTSLIPADLLCKSLGIEPRIDEAEINCILESVYQARYTNLVLSLLYSDWKDSVFHEIIFSLGRSSS